LGTYDNCGNLYGVDITNVIIGTIKNSTANYCNLPYSYNDYTYLSTTVTQGSSYPINVYSDDDELPVYWGIWVDWDNSGSFTDNANKFLVINNNKGGSLTGRGNIKVPTGATGGYHRMRIRASEATMALGDACSDLGWGEQEDYYLYIVEKQGINTIYNNITVNLYPNPVKKELSVEIANSHINRELEIFNNIGKVVYKSNITDKTIVNVSGFAEGIYIVRIFSDNSSFISKFVKL
jgi:hypothetical protein